jgi:AcrR family transcriptional regulator
MGLWRSHKWRLIKTTMKLAYKHVFRETSLADIAEAAHVPVGNVYDYFKTKDELGEAVVEGRLAEFRAFREEMGRLRSPKERLFAFVESIHRNREQLARGGCPLGGLCPELHKEGGTLAKKSAALPSLVFTFACSVYPASARHRATVTLLTGCPSCASERRRKGDVLGRRRQHRSAGGQSGHFSSLRFRRCGRRRNAKKAIRECSQKGLYCRWNAQRSTSLAAIRR